MAHRSQSIARLLVGLVLTSTGWLVGCQNQPTSGKTSPTSDPLVVGMRMETVKRLMGEPKTAVVGTGNNYVEETWTYEIEHPPVYRTIVAEMQDVPWVDPITGEMKTLQEPVNDQQRLDRRETVRLVFRYGQLITIDRKVDELRAFSR